jgi:hypothetical protein
MVLDFLDYVDEIRGTECTCASSAASSTRRSATKSSSHFTGGAVVASFESITVKIPARQKFALIYIRRQPKHAFNGLSVMRLGSPFQDVRCCDQEADQHIRIWLPCSKAAARSAPRIMSCRTAKPLSTITNADPTW